MEVPLNAIYYFLREGLWNQCKKFCHENYRTVNDPAYLFWKAYACYRNGQITEGINDLTTIVQKKEIQYATVVALIYYHKECEKVDNDAVRHLEMMESDSKRMSGDRSFVLLAHFECLNGRAKEAEDYLAMVNGDNSSIQNAKAWVELYNNSESSIQSALESFENVLQDEPRNLEALLGKAKASEMSKKFTVTIETLNEIVIVFPEFTPAISEKARLLMVIADWDQCLETVQKVLSQDERNMQALKIYVFYLLAREGNLEEGIEKLKFFLQTLEKAEPQNADQFFKSGQLFSRVSGRDPDVLKIALAMIERAHKLNPFQSEYVCEKANIMLMMGDVVAAQNFFQEAASIDDQNVEALTGMIRCRLLQGMIDDATQQLEFVNEVFSSVGRTPDLAFLEAMLLARKTDNDQNAKVAATVKTLDECLRLHIHQTKALNPGFEFYIRLNPDFLLSMCREYLQWLEIDIGKKVESVPPYVVKGNKLLETVTKQIPGLLAGHLLLAKGKLGAGDVGAALKHIERVIEINPKHMEATILYALISFQTGNVEQAYQCLEEAIANNFQVRENPLFMLIKGEIELKNNDKEAALATLLAAFNLPGAKTVNSKGKGPKRTQTQPGAEKKGNEPVLQLLTYTDKERCKLHILLAKAYIMNGKVKEAKDIMDEAIKNFSGTAEEGNVLMTNAELAVAGGDIRKALSILKAVESTSSYFVESRRLMANIYLNNMLDRRHYAQCYVDIIEAFPTYENYKALGDALMKIQEPEEAVTAYDRAMELNPQDEELVRLIGKALFSTHDYNQAMNYYENALKKDPNRHDLRLDMGKLLMYLNRLDQAEKLLKIEIFGDEFSAGTLQALKRNVEGMQQIARLQLKKAGKNEAQNAQARDAYLKACSMQSNVIEKTKQEGGNTEEERRYLSDLQFELAKYFLRYEKNYQKALDILEQAWKVQQTNEKILLSMAQTHLKLEDREGAEVRCIQVIKLNPYNVEASLLISDLMMMKGESAKGIKQFMRFLDYKTDFSILAETIVLLFRTGRSEEVDPILEKVQKQCPNPNDPGLCYCKGIYNKLKRNVTGALEEFYRAKRGGQWVEPAICEMIDLYLNPDQDLIYSNIGDSSKQVSSQNLNAAENLVREMKARGQSTKGSIAEAFVCISQKKLDAANAKIQEVLTRMPDYVPALLALALSKFVNGKKEDGKNALRQLGGRFYSHEWADELEQGWLLYADFLINANNLQDATEVLNRCLKFNQNCGKAEEYLGMILEKQQNLEEAAKHYESAWKLYYGKSPSVGYRLASIHLKQRDIIGCIEICKKVLNTYPDFQKIEKDVYSKARSLLRV